MAPSQQPAVAVDMQQAQSLRRLRQVMEVDKVYLQATINLEKLAGLLDISPKLLSSLINKHLEQNFFEMIRGYRIDEAKRRLMDEAYRAHAINQIMIDCGFNSKSVFNQAFKDRFGVTPSEWRKTARQAQTTIR